MTHPIQVREKGDGDFEVVRGGDIYRRWDGRIEPGTVSRGEIATASEICEWEGLGIDVRVSA
ncbi:MAG: hypothetical protein V4533_16810 [Pseudomonadota bacterium]